MVKLHVSKKSTAYVTYLLLVRLKASAITSMHTFSIFFFNYDYSFCNMLHEWFGPFLKSKATSYIESYIACLFIRRIVNGALKLETITFCLSEG